MTKSLNIKDIASEYKQQVFTQDYSGKPKIEGVQLIDIRNFVTEDGDFCELIRVDDKGCLELVPDFQLKQVNRSRMIPGSVKAWHLHFNQEDLWYIPPKDQLIVGLADCRADSPTKDTAIKYVLGGGKSQLLLIPRGVAHGAANVTPQEATIIYFINQQFDFNDPDERRLPWDTFGQDFWTPPKE